MVFSFPKEASDLFERFSWLHASRGAMLKKQVEEYGGTSLGCFKKFQGLR